MRIIQLTQKCNRFVCNRPKSKKGTSTVLATTSNRQQNFIFFSFLLQTKQSYFVLSGYTPPRIIPRFILSSPLPVSIFPIGNLKTTSKSIIKTLALYPFKPYNRYDIFIVYTNRMPSKPSMPPIPLLFLFLQGSKLKKFHIQSFLYL